MTPPPFRAPSAKAAVRLPAAGMVPPVGLRAYGRPHRLVRLPGAHLEVQS